MKHRIAFASALLALACLLAGAPSEAQRAEWDPDRVTQLAIELNEAVIDLQRAMRREPSQPVASGQSRARCLRAFSQLVGISKWIESSATGISRGSKLPRRASPTSDAFLAKRSFKRRRGESRIAGSVIWRKLVRSTTSRPGEIKGRR